MFDKQKYINSYIKNKYRDVKVRVRYDDKLIINKLNSVSNMNQYILDLIRKDAIENRVYHFINNDVIIDFELSVALQDLVDRAEEADLLDNYGIYMNLADAIDTRAKTETKRHMITESQWIKLVRRYPV